MMFIDVLVVVVVGVVVAVVVVLVVVVVVLEALHTSNRKEKVNMTIPTGNSEGMGKRWGPMWPLPSTQCPQVLDSFP